jgi:phosphatidylglycerol:prolipoprotein diacylglycerol transferase
MPISFPGLFGDWSINPDVVAVHIGHGIYWYGIILAAGMLAGLVLCMKQAKHYGLTEDNLLDMVLWAVPCCIVGSRTYYVLFYLDLFRKEGGGLDWGQVFSIWDGGLAIYGTVIAGFLVALIFCRHRKIRFGAMTDLGVMGLLLGQLIGRWANFINREAFGGLTTLPWRMRLWTSATDYIEVHPTFFYESLWNLVGLLLILFVVSKARRFDGENTWFYFLWYGMGRFWIEGLRTDSLYLFNWTFLGQRIRVSQAFSLVMMILAAVMLFYRIRIQKRSPEDLLVNIRAREAAAAAAAESAPSAEASADAGSTSSAAAAAAAESAPSAGAPADAGSTPSAEAPADAESTPDGQGASAPLSADEKSAPEGEKPAPAQAENREDTEHGDAD